MIMIAAVIQIFNGPARQTQPQPQPQPQPQGEYDINQDLKIVVILNFLALFEIVLARMLALSVCLCKISPFKKHIPK